ARVIRMNIQEHAINDITVLDLDGNFVIGRHGQFRKHVSDNIEAGGRRLILNLAKVAYIDSSGLGELVSCYTAMQSVGGTLKLIHLNDRLNKILVLTKLITVFETFDSESAAISSFTNLIQSRVDH
ncbi:MAG TPA: STAS domain-containing protein, partial [Blastocatellia bacterium]|nr:STAS domain-containing protein [Blastocatellia bacterium]